MLGCDYDAERITSNTHQSKIEVYPMGIDYDWIQKQLANTRKTELLAGLSSLIGNYKIIFSIDRLDYAKGINNRLSAFEKFLSTNPQWHKKVILVLIVAPSREDIPHYQAMRRQIEELVGHINGKFGNVDWTPILYQYKSYSLNNLLGLYSISDIGLVTPLADGMNLVAKEFVAAKMNKPGVLILSEAAGASKELMDAIIVNPHCIDEVAHAISRALNMNEEEQLSRLKNMQQRVKRYNVVRWGTDFINDLVKAHESQKKYVSRFINVEQLKQIIIKYNNSKTRALIFDYDGTLVPFFKHPRDAAPDSSLYSTLNKLVSDSANNVFIVSGRDKATLGDWLGGLNLTILAEHGALIKQDEIWKPSQSQKNDLSHVYPILEAYTDRLPGSFIEVKDYALVWHYRNANVEKAERLAKELYDTLITFTANEALQVLPGNKVIEVKPIMINKGIIAEVTNLNDYDFILVLGDDTTDEDMFKVMPENAISIKVGDGASVAKYNIKSQAEVITLLASLTC